MIHFSRCVGCERRRILNVAHRCRKCVAVIAAARAAGCRCDPEDWRVEKGRHHPGCTAENRPEVGA